MTNLLYYIYPLFTSDEERDFLKLLTTTSDLNLKSNLKYKPLESEYKPHIDYSTSYMNFSISTNRNKSDCGCKNVINFTYLT